MSKSGWRERWVDWARCAPYEWRSRQPRRGCDGPPPSRRPAAHVTPPCAAAPQTRRLSLAAPCARIARSPAVCSMRAAFPGLGQRIGISPRRGVRLAACVLHLAVLHACGHATSLCCRPPPHTRRQSCAPRCAARSLRGPRRLEAADPHFLALASRLGHEICSPSTRDVNTTAEQMTCLPSHYCWATAYRSRPAAPAWPTLAAAR
jgi:hypothetical protein